MIHLLNDFMVSHQTILSFVFLGALAGRILDHIILGNLLSVPSNVCSLIIVIITKVISALSPLLVESMFCVM